MNIEEAIKIVKKIRQDYNLYYPMDRKEVEATEILLTAYEKEKGLSEDEKTFIQLGEIIGEKKVKDKIKAKIEEIKKSKENIYFEEHLESILQSLLEKE